MITNYGGITLMFKEKIALKCVSTARHTAAKMQ